MALSDLRIGDLMVGELGQAPFIGGFGALLSVFLVVGFSFQGTELVGIAAAETENPIRACQRLLKPYSSEWHFFYIGSIIVVGTLIPFYRILNCFPEVLKT